jgi:hypothetical protein
MCANDAVEAPRVELVDLNEARIWAAVYPSDALQTMPPSHALVSGRRRETERHGFQSAVIAGAVFDLLRHDAAVFATISTRQRAAQIARRDYAALDDTEAMWDGSDEYRAPSAGRTSRVPFEVEASRLPDSRAWCRRPASKRACRVREAARLPRR